MNASPSKLPRAKLVIARPGGVTEEVLLPPRPFRIGRVQGNEIVITGDTAVSREHCVFERDPATGAVIVRDLGSVNGTYVNEQRVSPEGVALKSGDRVRAGSVVVTFVFEESGVAVPLPAGPAPAPNTPWPPREGDAARTVFGADHWVCGRCGARHVHAGLTPLQKVGCPRCRAVWRAPGVKAEAEAPRAHQPEVDG